MPPGSALKPCGNHSLRQPVLLNYTVIKGTTLRGSG